MKFSITCFLFLLLMPTAFGQIPGVSVAIDSVYMAGYRAIYSKYILDPQKPLYQWDIYTCDLHIMSTIQSETPITMFNFCKDFPCRIITCNLADLINSGRGIVAFCVADTGTSKRQSCFLYQLDTTGTMIGMLNGIELGFGNIYFENIDYDPLPEIIANDLNYSAWTYDGIQPPTPFIVWKWDGTQFRLANFKLGDFILNELYAKIDSINYLSKAALGDSLKSRKFDKLQFSTYPLNYMKLVLMYDFCVKDIRYGTVEFKLWPYSLHKEEEFLKVYNMGKQTDPIWYMIQNSAW